jgi:Uma2 family endonuclease
MTAYAEKPATQIVEGSYKFTLEQFEWLSDEGQFGDARVELLNGEITVKGRQAPHHAYVIQQLTKDFILSLEDRACVSPQLPMLLPFPPADFVLPDVALLRVPDDEYKYRNVESGDALLVIEVSDTTLIRDQGVKLEAYARNTIPEVWILNLNKNLLEVYREPFDTEYASNAHTKLARKSRRSSFLTCCSSGGK